jgi:Carboxypeptidase regulatory-like domain
MPSECLSRLSCLLLCLPSLALAQASVPRPAAENPQQVQELERSQLPSQRIPQQKGSGDASLQGLVLDSFGRLLPGVEVRLTVSAGSSPAIPFATTSGDGIFRLVRLRPGTYDLSFTRSNAPSFLYSHVELHAGEVLSIEVHLSQGSTIFRTPLNQTPAEVLGESSYRELSRRPDADGAIVVAKETALLAESDVFWPMRDRWEIAMPGYHRYPELNDNPYILGHWFDPFNRNRFKADKPIFGKTFFSFTGDSITAAEGRRLPLASGQSTATPGSPDFFGRGGQFFLAQTFRLTFDLFHGDTAAFRPVDWRVRLTPAANINYLKARENQIVSPDVRAGTTRLDGFVGMQEAFGEVKLHDFGPNYDFLNLRAGIQQFSSDFRGFIFADEQPGIRLFGNLRSNRIQYNLAAFDLLEKNTNSGLNRFKRRSREVVLANFFVQDFLTKGYTTQFSYHFVRDNATTQYDDNGFLVRPAPIGTVTPHRIAAEYYGWTGDGHIGRYNITHAFYQVLGTDTLNQLANRSTGINAQFAAAELSQDRDWIRFRASFLYSSGDNNPRDGTARGFSSIVDGVAFAGGEFSFFNREGISLTRAGVALTAPDSFLPDLRSSKDQGQSNFVNPGLYLYNAGAEAEFTPQLKLIGNVNFLQFARTQPLVFLLQQSSIRRTIGVDSGIGIIYRPFLSDNIILHAGVAALAPGRGLRDIYTGQTLVSVFAVIKFQF